MARGDQLFITLDGYAEREMIALSPSRFRSNGQSTEVGFEGGGAALVLQMAGRDRRATREVR